MSRRMLIWLPFNVLGALILCWCTAGALIQNKGLHCNSPARPYMAASCDTMGTAYRMCAALCSDAAPCSLYPVPHKTTLVVLLLPLLLLLPPCLACTRPRVDTG
jgi:hypothetical protein